MKPVIISMFSVAVLTLGLAAQADPWKDESGHGRGGAGWARQGGEPPDWARGKGVWDGHLKHGKRGKDDWKHRHGPVPYGGAAPYGYAPFQSYAPAAPYEYGHHLQYAPSYGGYRPYGSYPDSTGHYYGPAYGTTNGYYWSPPRSGYGRAEFWWRVN